MLTNEQEEFLKGFIDRSEKNIQILGKREVTVSPEPKKSPKLAAKETAPPATSIDKVVIGVLDFETGGDNAPGFSYLEPKRALMRDLKRNTRVKLVDIRESCSLSDLKRHGHEGAERYKNIYQLDMILHTCRFYLQAQAWRFDFGLMDLYTKKVNEVSIEIREISVELALRGISRKILVSQDLDRVLEAKTAGLPK